MQSVLLSFRVNPEEHTVHALCVWHFLSHTLVIAKVLSLERPSLIGQCSFAKKQGLLLLLLTPTQNTWIRVSIHVHTYPLLGFECEVFPHSLMFTPLNTLLVALFGKVVEIQGVEPCWRK